MSGYSLNSILALSFCSSVHFSDDLNNRYLLLTSSSLRVSPFSKVNSWYAVFPTSHSLSRHLLAVKQTSGALFSSVARHHLQVSVYESDLSLVWLLENNVLLSYAYCRTSPRWPHQLLSVSFHLSYPIPFRHPRTWFMQQLLQDILPCRVCPC